MLQTKERTNQRTPDGDWLTWLILSGRGFGKTRMGAEDFSDYCRSHPGTRLAMVGATLIDVRDTMVEGESGLLSVLPADSVKNWNRSLAALELDLHNGCHIKGFSAEMPNKLRGPQHHRAWCDELAAWRYPRETWDMLMFGLRLGTNPQVLVTTTPRPIGLVKELAGASTTIITRGSTYDNLDNLAPTLKAQILARYEGTSLGRQEIYGEIVDEVDGALWRALQIEETRSKAPEDLVRIVVAVDPAGGSSEDNDETGIIVAGRLGNHGWVLDDLSCRESPEGWASRAIAAYDKWNADRIVCETNYGGAMVESTIRSVRRNVPVTTVTASRGKRQRAEPVSALYEQGRIHHDGCFAELESQMTSWLPDSGRSPDRMDALVWAFTSLFGGTTNTTDFLDALVEDHRLTDEAIAEGKGPVTLPEFKPARDFLTALSTEQGLVH